MHGFSLVIINSDTSFSTQTVVTNDMQDTRIVQRGHSIKTVTYATDQNANITQVIWFFGRVVSERSSTASHASLPRPKS